MLRPEKDTGSIIPDNGSSSLVKWTAKRSWREALPEYKIERASAVVVATIGLART